MADFDEYYPELIQEEGGYSNVSGDRGGETYRGISRVDNPNWSGWAIIDQKARTHNEIIPELEPEVIEFYKTNYWNPFLADQFNSQSVAEFSVDWGINSGIETSIKHLQKSVNTTPDGKIGPITLGLINSKDPKTLFITLQNERKQFYLNIITANPEDEKFKDGWFNRVNNFLLKTNNKWDILLHYLYFIWI